MVMISTEPMIMPWPSTTRKTSRIAVSRITPSPRRVGVWCGSGWLPRWAASARVPTTAQPSTVSRPGTGPIPVATQATRIGPAMKTTWVVTPSTA